MYYFTADTIYQANEKIKTLDAKAGGLLCILHCLTENIVENISYTINGEMLRKQLSFVFDREYKDSFDNSKASYIIFAKDWPSTFFSSYIKNKIDLLSCAVFFLRRYGFEREFTKEEVIDTFIRCFNLTNYKDDWFSDESNFTITYNQYDVEVNQTDFYSKRKYAKEFKSILFNGVIQKSAADLKAAGQIQTLYSGSGIQKCFLLSDEPLDKYYIMDKSSENPEERNKRLFRYWMKMQVKPEGDSDAGNPYSEASIDQYVNNIANTPSPSEEGKSLFVTTDEEEVSFTIDVLDNAEKKNNTQRSAVRKYLQYVQMLDNDNEDIFNHELFGMHIKEKNDALSEENPHVCIGWSNLGDLSDIDSKEQLSELYEANYDKNNRGRGQDVGQIWRFIHDMKVGDYVIFAENSEFHIGRIESDYCYDTTERESQDSDYKSNRKVKWLKKNISRNVLSTNLHNSLKTAMSIWTLNDYKSAVLDLLRGTYAKDGDIDMASEYIEPVYNTDLSVKYERNRIVFGAPGTGKSFRLKNDCEELMEKTSGTYERVTFHPDYSYSQFVGTYKPVMGEDNNSIRYDFVAGPFMRVYVDAIKSGRTGSPKAHLLLIEEINRAKVAAVFGDVFQLLDRDSDGVSEYEIQASEDIRRYLAKELGGLPDNYNKIKLPNNMFIWATMNSADQGVFPMDTAFKRRWNFEYLGINESEKDIIGVGKIVLPGETDAVEWNAVRRAINDRMASEYRINEDKLMGPFFLAKKVIASDENGMIIDTEKFMDAFKSKVIMYLYEDAVKQRKHDFFNGCDSSKYSSVCEAFEEKGMAIFGTSVKNAVYNK